MGSFEYFDHYAGKVIDKNGYFFAFSVNCLEGGSKNGEVMYHVESHHFSKIPSAGNVHSAKLLTTKSMLMLPRSKDKDSDL